MAKGSVLDCFYFGKIKLHGTVPILWGILLFAPVYFVTLSFALFYFRFLFWTMLHSGAARESLPCGGPYRARDSPMRQYLA
jgi:hypothetical protein